MEGAVNCTICEELLYTMERRALPPRHAAFALDAYAVQIDGEVAIDGDVHVRGKRTAPPHRLAASVSPFAPVPSRTRPTIA